MSDPNSNLRNMTAAPKAFISHATEDKDRFVIPFAIKLRERGVDAWVDQWEIKAGESLVDHIFEDGIKEASVFIVVLSQTSIAKPWVRDELDAGVLKRIAGKAKLIPIILDEVEVPVSLQHTLYLSVPREGLERVLEKTIHSIFEINNRPPLGPPPAYASSVSPPQVLPDAVDNAVFNAIVDLTLDGSAGTITRESLSEAVARFGVSSDALEESVSILESRGHIQVRRALNGNWFLGGITPSSFLRALETKGIDIKGLQLRLLADIVNDSTRSYRTFEGQPRIVTDCLLHSLEARKLISCSRVLSGDIVVQGVSAEATRIVRRSS